jgi:fructose-1,6-bisphosphatase/inositol monophosphatase family enzyme
VSIDEKEWQEAGALAATLTDGVRRAMEAVAATALLPRYRRLRLDEREEKSAGEWVTVADHESEMLLSRALGQLLPQASIVGEEAVHAEPALMERLGDELCWIVDPLDGTGNFADGEGPFGMIVALAKRGRAVGGWILDPLSGRFSWAAAGQGSWIGERRMAVRQADRPPSVGLSALLKREPERFATVLESLSATFKIGDIPRCAAANYPAMLLEGPDLILYQRTLPWDHAAGVLMIEEAGGRAARLDGLCYRVDDDRAGLLVAADPVLWGQAAALLVGVVA